MSTIKWGQKWGLLYDRVLSSLILLGFQSYPDFDPRLALPDIIAEILIQISIPAVLFCSKFPFCINKKSGNVELSMFPLLFAFSVRK